MNISAKRAGLEADEAETAANIGWLTVIMAPAAIIDYEYLEARQE